MKKDTIENMQKIAKERGGRCLSDKYINNSSKLLWECKNGHRWLNTPSHIKDGQWCKICAGLKKNTIEEMQMLAQGKGGVCLSKKYINIDTKLTWRCSKGHTWKATPYSIKNRTWCPKCAGRVLPTINELNELIKKKKGICLSKEHKNSKVKLKWQCVNKHIWEATAYSVLKQNSWCPICAGNTPKNITFLHEVAKKRGGKCLSEKYINVDAKYQWQCSLGHKFTNSFNRVNHGQWCPICSKSGISEEACRIVFEGIFKDKFQKVRPKWLKNDKGYQMEIDGFSKKMNIGFEYQGIQHFETTNLYSKTKEDLKQRHLDDLKKEKLCYDHGVKLFILTYKTGFTDFSKEIKKQAIKMDLDISKFNFDEVIDFNKVYIRNDRINELELVLSEKNLKLLSSKYLGVKEKYYVECLVDGYKWYVLGSEILKGVGCKKCAMRNLHNKQTGSMQNLIDYANKFEGKVLSKKYINAQSKYKFMCKNGHEFEAKFNNMKFRNQWCPICEKRHIRIKNK